ncbi:acyl-CoA synthetase [Comamonas testosteroni]|uniref:Acyl-CoA synthetase n=1 Tax=Comamonas testosteroni TaxID=285 RepID=A0A5A7MGE3_COMTE|nr:long-chain-fatty-acid--CoA ligase [Comamonas testosteroni]GEQ76803.1 acyl-CoA synthetase [Comamonas testosteroni]
MSAQNLIDCLMQQAEQSPQTALFTAGLRTVSFAEMNRQTNQLANALKSLGVGPQDRVALLSKSQIDSALLIFACMKIGAVGMPINWRFSVDEVRFVLEDSDAHVLIIDTEFLDRIDARSTSSGLRIFTTDGADPEHQRLDSWLAAFSDQLPATTLEAHRAAIHIYSSGTTGQPKGVVLTHKSLLSACQVTTEAWGLEPHSVLGHVVPIFHIAGLLILLFPVYMGCRCVAFRDFKPASFLAALSNQSISHVLLVPAMINFLLAEPADTDLDFSQLKLIAYGGSPITEPVLQAAMQRFNCDFSQIYGLTEVAGVVTNLTPEDHRKAAGLLRSGGRPLPRTELRIVDPVTLTELEDGQVGEVWIRSDRNFHEYWQKPEATQEVYPEGRDALGGWFRSGDAGYLLNGYLFLSDRIKDMIISGAENIYPAELENTLMKHPAIADGAIIGVPDPVWGESVKACVVLRPGTTLSEDELINFMREQVAHFKCPKSVEFLTSLPRTESGKLLKRQLRAPYWAGQERAIN